MHLDRSELAAIFVGGAAGALARVGLTQLFPNAGANWPWTVFIINLAGAFILGYLVAHVDWRGSHRLIRPLLGPGFCGALTTFSTMQLEVLEMIRAGHGWLALAYALASIVGGLGAVQLATLTVRSLATRFPGPGGRGLAAGADLETRA